MVLSLAVVFVLMGLNTDVFGRIDVNIPVSVNDLYYGRQDNDEVLKADKLESVLNDILSSDETYFDFSNGTNFYSYVNRVNPVYENQCPCLINGEFGQNEVINILKNDQETIPLVLMRSPVGGIGYQIDGISNIDRHYLVTEYIYDNYVPLYSDEIPVSYRANGVSFCSDIHFLGYIPYLWANYDLENEEYDTGCYLMLKIDSDNNPEQCLIEVGYTNDSCEYYCIDLVDGVNDYKIRISTDYDLTLSDIAYVQILNSFTEGNLNYIISCD